MGGTPRGRAARVFGGDRGMITSTGLIHPGSRERTVEGNSLHFGGRAYKSRLSVILWDVLRDEWGYF